VYVTYNAPHSPMQVPDRWWNKFKNKELTLRATQPQREDIAHTRAALAMCENIDWNVGRLLRRIDELKIADDTIVVYFSDNGPNGDRWNGGFKGIKGSTDEGGLRSPLLIRRPGKIAAGKRIPQIAAAIDLLPTLAELADVPLTNEKPLDGLSLQPLLESGGLAGHHRRDDRRAAPAEQNPPVPLADDSSSEAQALLTKLSDRVIVSHWNGRISAASGPYRLDHTGKLYDVTNDPGQRRDLSRQHPQIKNRLAAARTAWKNDVFRESQRDERPFLVGHPGHQLTQFPARDALAYGNIQRSSRHPNCSFFTNWKSTGDRITWDVEVVTGGTYEVEIYYACPEADVGSTIELSFDDSRLQAEVAEPHDPPLTGADDDRVPRTESYVKDFRPMKLGAIHLPEGRGQLALQALEIPGAQVMDLRLLVLTRVEE
jgi:hypothetical protein